MSPKNVQKTASFSPFLMNIDSLVSNAFFLSTNQRNPYKLASSRKKKIEVAEKPG